MENNDIIKVARAKAEKWLDKAYDEETRVEVQRLLNNTDTTELVESFYNDLEFGTGGLRGIMGVGTNRMNIYTVGAATQGFSNYINQMFPNEKKAVCIGHDCRHNSHLFSETAPISSRLTEYMFTCLKTCAPPRKCRTLSGN